MGWIGGIPAVSAVKVGLNSEEPGPAGRTADAPYERIHHLDEHVHSASNVYPTLAGGVVVSTGAGAWQEGAFVEIVPASTISGGGEGRFDIHWVSVENISANGVYELSLYSGAGDTEIARVRFTKSANLDGVQDINR
jgi:hypothetical protein